MASSLNTSARYNCALPPDQLLATLSSAVEPIEGGFKFISKLSGGGVVIRVLRSPETQLGWFGIIEQDRFSVAMIAKDKSGSPYQPILRGQVSAQNGGSSLSLDLSTHPDARAFSVLYTIGGVLLAAASLLAVGQSPPMALTGLAFAALFLAFPSFRAKVSFQAACEASLEALEKQLGLQPMPSSDTVK